MTTRERVRVKTGVPEDSDFDSPLGTPLVLDDTGTTGGLWYMDADGNATKVAGPYIATYPWTPGISFGGGTTGITYTTRVASLTKVGTRCAASGMILLSSKGSSTGSAKITGLPFTISNNNDAYSPVNLYFVNITFTGQFQGFGVINSTTIQLAQCTEAGVASDLTDANFTNTSQIFFSIVYKTDQ